MFPAEVMPSLHDLSSLGEQGPGVAPGMVPRAEKNQYQW